MHGPIPRLSRQPVDADAVEEGVAILFNVTTSDTRGATVECLDDGDRVLHTIPLS